MPYLPNTIESRLTRAVSGISRRYSHARGTIPQKREKGDRESDAPEIDGNVHVVSAVAAAVS